MPLQPNNQRLITTIWKISHVIGQLQSSPETLGNSPTFPKSPIPYARGHRKRLTPEREGGFPSSSRGCRRGSHVGPYMYWWADARSRSLGGYDNRSRSRGSAWRNIFWPCWKLFVILRPSSTTGGKRSGLVSTLDLLLRGRTSIR